MFKPAQMQKIRLVALNSVSKELVSYLHHLGLVEITRIPESELASNTPFSDYSQISSKIVKLRSIANTLGKFLPKHSNKKIAEEKIDDFEKEIRSLVAESSEIQNQIKKYKESFMLANSLSSFNFDFSNLKTSLSDYTVGVIPRSNLAKCISKLEQYKNELKYVNKVSKKEAMFCFIHKSDIVVEVLLNEFSFIKLNLPEDMTYPSAYKESALSQIQKLNIRLSALNTRLARLSEDYQTSILKLIEKYEIESQRSEIGSKFGFSSDLFVMEGWMEKNKIENFKAKLSKEFDGKVYILNVSKPYDKPPTKLENPSAMGTTEFFVKMFSLPNSGEIDPTFLFFFTAPLFFGMIMGDVIYGILSLFVSLFLLWTLKPKGLLLFTIRLWMFSAIPAIFFGVIFDEWMALNHVAFFNFISTFSLPTSMEGPLYVGFSRIHNLTLLVGLSALIGVINLAFGFLLGAFNEWNHNRKHAIAKLAWFGVDVFGTIAIMSYMFSMFPPDIGFYSAIILGVCAVVIIFIEGIIGALEIPGLAGNILSYTRIAAVGVVGVVLAEIINKFIIPLIYPSDMVIAIIMLLVLILMHALNTLIVMVEALIQGGRLNIVEFQSKFLHGGGRLFSPFALKDDKNLR